MPGIIVFGLGLIAVRAFDFIIQDAGTTADKMGNAAQKSSDLASWVVAGGALYVAYQVFRAQGVAK